MLFYAKKLTLRENFKPCRNFYDFFDGSTSKFKKCMKSFKDNSGVQIRSGQLIRYQGDVVLRVVSRGHVLFGIPVKGKYDRVPLEVLCDGKDVCENVDVLAKRPLK